MKNMKFWRTALVATLVLTIMLSVTGGTIAWFTDSVESGANVIKSGTLDVEVYYGDGNSADSKTWKNIEETKEPLFNYTLWEPGYVATKGVKIVNAGDLAFKYQLKFLPNAQSTGAYKLEDVIDVYVSDTAITSRDSLGENVGTLASLMNTDNAVHGEMLAKKDDVIYIALKMQESAGNDYQNLSVGNGFGIELLATQHTDEKDSFDDQYDADATYPQVVAVYNNDELATAIANGATKIVLGAGNYYMPDEAKGKTLTLVGTKDVVMTVRDDGQTESDGDYSLRGSNVIFENMTLKVVGTFYAGYVGCNATYNNCVIDGNIALYGTSTFNDCTFNQSGYVSTWSADVASFNNCVFNTAGKAILVYSDYPKDNTRSQTVNVHDCTFNATAPAYTGNKKHVSAVSVDSTYVKDYTVNFTGTNKVDEDFNGLWQVKNGTEADPTPRTTINVDGKTVSMKSVANQEALTAALTSTDANIALTLNAGNYTMPSVSGKNISIAGSADANITLGNCNLNGGTVEFDGVTVTGRQGGLHYSVLMLDDAKAITYKNCTINACITTYANTEFVGCTFNNSIADYSVFCYDGAEIKITDCVFNVAGKAIKLYDEGNGPTTAYVTGCTFNSTVANKAAVEIDSSYSAQTAYITDCTLGENFNALWNSDAGEDTKTTVYVNDELVKSAN